MEENKAQKAKIKLAKDKLEKDKCRQEESAMSLANRVSKSILECLWRMSNEMFREDESTVLCA